MSRVCHHLDGVCAWLHTVISSPVLSAPYKYVPCFLTLCLVLSLKHAALTLQLQPNKTLKQYRFCSPHADV